MTEEDDILAAEHALGLLEAGERRAFEARLADEPALRAARAGWEERFARMADDLPAKAPPGRVRRALDRRLFADRPNAGPNWSGWLWGAAGMASAAVVAGFLILSAPQEEGLPGRIASAEDDLVLAALYSPGPGMLHVRREEGDARPGRSLELWIIGPDQVPVSLGVLPEARDAAFRIPESHRSTVTEAVFAITDERPGGSPSGAPSGAPIAVGGLREG